MVVIWVAKAERTQNNLSAPPLAPSRAGAVPITLIRQGLLSHRRVHCVAGFIPTWEWTGIMPYVSLYPVIQSRAWNILSAPYLQGKKPTPHMGLCNYGRYELPSLKRQEATFLLPPY